MVEGSGIDVKVKLRSVRAGGAPGKAAERPRFTTCRMMQ